MLKTDDILGEAKENKDFSRIISLTEEFNKTAN
jgi:hypothetical protein